MDETKLTFQDWLLSQVPRQDPAGQLARRSLQIDTYARIDNSYPSWHRLFASHASPEELSALMQVWNEYLEARADLKRKPQ